MKFAGRGTSLEPERLAVEAPRALEVGDDQSPQCYGAQDDCIQGRPSRQTLAEPPFAAAGRPRSESSSVPVIDVKLYDRRVTEESVPKMIEALTNALHESSGAAKEHIQVIIQGVDADALGPGRQAGRVAASAVRAADGRHGQSSSSTGGAPGADRLRLAGVQQRRPHDQLRAREVVELGRHRADAPRRARSRPRCGRSRGRTSSV